MATPTPAKLKTYLGEFKEKILDSSADGTVSSQWNALLCAELIQRGVLVSIEDAILGPNATKVMGDVQSTAGRPLLDTSFTNLPKPLLAAASALAGMVCEQCATMEKEPPTVESYTDVLRRCKEVEDGRLTCMLELISANHSDDPNMTRYKLLWMAQGYYLRAASFQPDPPQMWKKCVDVIALRNNPSLEEAREALMPLSRLMDIASSKNNEKRVSELSLRLAESLLSKPEKIMDDETKKIVDAFVTPYGTGEDEKEADKTPKARDILERCNLDLLSEQDESAALWYKLLSLRIEVAHEDALIEQLTSELQTSSKNRGVTLTSEDAIGKARSKVWRETFVDNPLDIAARNLRDVALLAGLKGEEQPRSEAAKKLLSRQAKRLVDRAQTMSVASSSAKPTVTIEQSESAWGAVADFAGPILTMVDEGIVGNTCVSLKERIQLSKASLLSLSPATLDLTKDCSLALSCYSWMKCGRSIPSDEAWSTAGRLECLTAILGALLSIEMENGDLAEDSGVVKASTDQSSVLELECAYGSALSLALLANAPEDPALIMQDATEEAISMSEKLERYDLFQSKYGTSFLQFLVCWSGLFRSPWPFCNIRQARVMVRHAKDAADIAFREWGRKESNFEALLLDIGLADTEGGYLGGGLHQVAVDKYESSIRTIDGEPRQVSLCLMALLRAHCFCGLAKVKVQGSMFTEDRDLADAESLSREALDIISGAQESGESGPIYTWRSTLAIDFATKYHKSAARQQLADCLVRSGRSKDAEQLFEASVSDSPNDFDAALALGAFRLRMALYELPSDQTSAEMHKQAQVQLLKAAKLNPQKAGPFALLGVWYEEKGDAKRASGCYSKALLLDPSNPVSGRGILRMKKFVEVKGLCESATNVNSPFNGWAWRAVGQEKSLVDGSDELAAICFHKAIRCKDIERPDNETFGTFYLTPSTYRDASVRCSEQGSVWIELAQCYRRLGRYSAAVRAFESAWRLDHERMPSVALCSWAQVEVELGLFEDAIDKFGVVVGRKDYLAPAAAHGQATALLSVAQRDAQDGKGGSAYSLLCRGIKLLQSDEKDVASHFWCALKLVGDLYSFGAFLPPDVFGDVVSSGTATSDFSRDQLVRSQLAFVSHGEEAYAAAETQVVGDTEDERKLARATILCDLGANLLLQAQILAALHGQAEGRDWSMEVVFRESEEVQNCYKRSAEAFKLALDAAPTFGPAWGGLGCAICVQDPLMAQHAFSTSLRVDKTLPESWSNLGFLYAREEQKASAEMLDSLTQAADSPMMWIGRALMLESVTYEESDNARAAAAASRAADSYRAALQVLKHPNALVGLSLTCRIGTGSSVSFEKARVEGHGYMREYMGSTQSTDSPVSLIDALMRAEDGIARSSLTEESSFESLIEDATSIIRIRRKLVENSGAEIDCTLLSELENQLTGADISTQEKSDDFGSDVQSLSRQIITDPENSGAWLHLAKSLAGASVGQSKTRKRKQIQEATQNAILAADKAASLLLHQVSQPVLAKESSKNFQVEAAYYVSAANVSEALSLACWLRMVDEDGWRGTSKDEAEHKANLQRAFFLCPDNAFARNAVEHIAHEAPTDSA